MVQYEERDAYEDSVKPYLDDPDEDLEEKSLFENMTDEEFDEFLKSIEEDYTHGFEETEPPRETSEEATQAFNRSKFVFAKGVSRSLNDFETGLNNNVLVVGTSGCGKTTSYIEPNLVDPEGCFVLSDPKGTLLKKHRRHLEECGYNVIVMDFQNPERSVHWNPLANVRSSQDILRIAHTITFDRQVRSTKNDPFWDNIDLMYICALIGYMIETDHRPCNFRSIMDLMNEGDRFPKSDSINGYRFTNEKASLLFERFEKLHRKDPHSWAYDQFCAVNSAAEKTYDSIRVTMASKFANFTTRELEKMMSRNDIDFTQIAKERTAVFVLQSDCDRSLDGLVNLFFSQAINSLIAYADTCENQRLPIPVRFFLDDYGATTAIDNLDTIISTIRSRAISVSLILQSESQLASGKPGADKTVLANCDTYIYMGGNDVDTARSVSLRCNKPLEQILYMPVGRCWIFERGKKPVCTEISERPDIGEKLISSPEYDCKAV